MDIPWDGMNSSTDVDVSGRGAGTHPMEPRDGMDNLHHSRY